MVFKSFPVGGGPESDYSVCPRPCLRRFTQGLRNARFTQGLRRYTQTGRDAELDNIIYTYLFLFNISIVLKTFSFRYSSP